ncbi:hypothetical protein N7462_003030 [Penicillium macrosclerotiorum]|uniref:uncharacterized protein n=1 Tax=Penicillium macrosclerotiorum TaxID=303699 RepID=UPI0025492114|nr:uncharacterized protein N7462_003030 [Penicillium macrosclerotiorum]KAJ5688638.1 hypothetical protein N7462_003030 [Penicillium macrosclerotiorum]
MTTSNSPEAVADPANASAAAPYGTRSRGRNAPRPNYAEDRDIDMELEAAPTKTAKLSPVVKTSTPVIPEKTASAPPRKSLTNGVSLAKGTVAAESAPKESIPGTSSFSARPEDVNGAGSLRKRKQPASTPTSSTNTGNAAKRIFTSAPGESDSGYFTNMMSFEASGPFLRDGQIKSDDGTTFAVNDHVYLICEPPGEPYYLARIMEFLPSKTKESGVIEALRVNWYYRPRDIQRHSPDTRYLYASMHSDTCPLSSLRGKCLIKHVSEIDDMNSYKKGRDSFWYDKMFDRYIHRLYDVIPTKDVVNVPPNVKRVLDDRWKFILVEMGKGKELTGAVKTCKRCHLFAANAESVDCAVCRSTYHMGCVRPALTKKPARGFAWACAPCSRAQERKLEARNTPLIGETRAEGEDEVMEEEEEDHHHLNGVTNGTSVSTPAAIEDSMPQPETAEQMAQARMWPYRYLGMHCRVEDALDYDDRIYPRASSRLGPRHQAIVNPWPGRPVEYVKPVELKKKYSRVSGGGQKVTKLTSDSKAALEAAKQEKATRPKWVQDQPTGYIQRGEDEPVTMNNGKQARTAEILFKMPTADQLPARGEDDAPGSHLSDAEREAFIDDYMRQARELAPDVGVEKYCTNFLDKALELLYSESFNADAALAKLKKVNKYKDLKEPHLRPEELKLFEQAVGKFGSEWRHITKHVKTVPHYQIVRFYYMWKKTPRGRQIWGSYEGRRGKKEVRRQSVVSSKLLDDVADDHDDSAFDNEKAAIQKRGFQCKFCTTRSSRQWRRAPGVPPGTTVPSEPSAKKDKGPMLAVALCLRCALLWRKYALQYEDIDEVGKRIAASGNKSWRRRIDEELLAQMIVATETPFSISSATAATAVAIGIPVDLNPQLQPENKLDKKKPRSDVPSTATSTATSVEPMPKKKIVVAEKTAEGLPVVPDPPRAKTLPCAVCSKVEPMGEEHVSCRDCRLTVHRNCYGVPSYRAGNKWLCDMCSNDRSPSISTTYECVLCPVTWTEHDLMETTKNNSRKKSDRDKEKERLEKEMVTEAIKLYRQRQEAVGKPVGPREPLKRTAGNNWAHVMCTLWTPEIKYGDAVELEPAEGFGSIPKDRWREVCKICKSSKGACVPCHFTGCNAHFHVGCAFQAGYRLGLDVTPVKGSRKDSVQTIRLGSEAGMATPVIYCPNHSVSTTVHEVSEAVGQDGLNALQLFARTYKQADLTLTGTSRKAAYMQQSIVPPAHPGISAAQRRASTSSALAAPKDTHKPPPTPTEDVADEMDIDTEDRAPAPQPVSGVTTSRRCVRCSADYSPRWWPSQRRTDPRGPLSNGVGLNSASPSFPSRHLAQGSFTAHPNGDAPEPAYECHKCHLKNPPVPEPAPDPRPSPYSAQRPMLPRIGAGHTFVPHSHSAPTGVLGRPLPPAHSHSAHSGYVGGYDPRPGPDSGLRNGMSPPVYSAGPPPPPPPHHLGGYPSAHIPGPSPSPYANAGPPPPPPSQPYATHQHQSPYGPVTARSPHLSQAPPRPYPSSASPPIVQATVNRSPQTSLSALNGGPPHRMYSVDRGIGAPSHSPPVAQARLDPRGPTPPNRPGDTPPSLVAGRHPGVNGTSSGSGASASPSLKNLLS